MIQLADLQDNVAALDALADESHQRASTAIQLATYGYAEDPELKAVVALLQQSAAQDPKRKTSDGVLTTDRSWSDSMKDELHFAMRVVGQ